MSRIFHFNSRPRVGSDTRSQLTPRQIFNFNSRPRVGSDGAGGRLSGPLGISIHAPAWGATGQHPAHGQGLRNFNSRPRVGSDAGRESVALDKAFQFTPPRGERRAASCWACAATAFQFTPPRGERPDHPCRSRLPGNFNSRPRVGSDRRRGRSTGTGRFQFTPPRGERRRRGRGAPQGLLNFNSRPRVGSDRFGTDFEPLFSYFNSRPRVGSDHVARTDNPHAVFQFTPPRGGRPSAISCSLGASVFQFTPPRGGRLRRIPKPKNQKHFNSRPRVGSDPSPPIIRRPENTFQFTPPRGERLLFALLSSLFQIFQFTPPRGERQKRIGGLCDERYFNSRPRVGGDIGRKPVKGLIKISIHAPAWGATASLRARSAYSAFQFTPPRGGRPKTPLASRNAGHFNSRPRVGGDWSGTRKRRQGTISIHAPAWGATRGREPEAVYGMISIHAPAWGATAPPAGRAG